MKISRPQYIARKSKLVAVRWWHVVFFWTIIPLIHLLCRIVSLKNQYVEFYDHYVIIKEGVFRKSEEKHMFPKVLSVNVERSFWGRIFNYGNIHVDAIGKWDVPLNGVKHPLYIRKYLENHFISTKEVKSMRQTVITQ